MDWVSRFDDCVSLSSSGHSSQIYFDDFDAVEYDILC